MSKQPTTNNRQPTKIKIIGFLVTLFVVGCWSLVAVAQETAVPTEYTLLAPIPLQGAGGPTSYTTNATTYVSGLFKLVIGIALGLAVLRLIYAGIKYMSTDAFGEKNEARSIIEEAMWGLLLAISAWLILNTINPRLVDIKFDIEPQEFKGETFKPPPPGTPIPGSCTGCVNPSVNHKLPEVSANQCGRDGGCGCAYPGPCTIQGELNARLVALNELQPSLYLTEMYPPTREHKDPCHSNGSCVDATISSTTEARIKKLIENAATVGLRAEFETTTEKRAEDIRRATGLTKSQVFYVPGITGEHFSIYYQ